MLSTEKCESSTYVKSLEHRNDLKHHKTTFVQIPPRTETRLVTECKDDADGHTKSIAACFHLSLLKDERVKFSLCKLYFGPPNPAKFKQPIQQLPKEVESRIIVTSNDDLRIKTAHSLPNRRTRGNCREDVAHEILMEATTVSTEFFWRKLLFIFSRDDNRWVPSKKCSSAIAQSTNDSGACTPPISQFSTPLHFLYQTIHKSGELPEYHIAIIGTPRVQFGKTLFN